jgi:putative ABC transport system permease protein
VIARWTIGLVRRRWGRVVATAAGVAAAVALVACLGSFLAAAQSSMTARAIRSVSVDWQVEVQPGAQPATVLDTVHSTPGIRAALPVGFAQSSGLVAHTGGSTQTTGPATVLGIPSNYREQFPDAIRTLVGTDNGVLIAQQSAANLHVAPGDSVQIKRAGMASVDVVVDGVVDVLQADSLFQKVRAPPGAQPAAPPDNVLLLGEGRWHQVFDPVSARRPDLVSVQIHAALDHTLHPAPGSAYTQVNGAAHNLEARSAGGALVGDNLGAALGAARGDAAYAGVLFLFLGLLAAVLAGLLTATVVAAGADRRRREQALLRARGATQRQLMWLAAAEATVVGVGGSAAGLAAAALVGLAEFGSPNLGADARTAVGWAVASAAVGMGIAAASVLAPAWRDVRDSTVVTARAAVIRTRAPRWARSGIDVVILVLSGMLFWQARRTGYQIVLAPEGVPTISVSYWAFVAPALLWIGAALLAWRLSDMLLGRGWTVVARALRPLAGKLSRIVAHSLSRQRVPMARAIVLLALAVAFAASTATFNATYRAQAEVDAQLTNGADITVTEPPGSSVSAGAAVKLAAVPGVRAVEPIQHRFAYVGADLQDLYGVNSSSITNVTALQDNYFQGGTVEQLMNKLAAQPDSLLVSAETVKDYQLRPGDTVNLRIQDARTNQLVTVGFHYIGIVTEFPTAPKDSFFVANAGYIAQQTGTDAIGAFLVDTGGHDTTAVADRIKAAVGTSAAVTDITTAVAQSAPA